MKAKADGRLRHCFFGTYSAVIALGFADEYQAAQALPKLGKGWKLGEKSKKALIWQGSSEELDECTKVLVSFGAEEKAIASIAHSIDYGDPFSIEVEITPQEQASLF
jgi:hypothetical protein